MSREARVARGFDRLAPFYEPLTRLLPGDPILGSQTRLLAALRDRRRALLVGGGAGAFLAALLRCGFRGEIVCLDVSQGMVARSRRRLTAAEARRVRFVRGGVSALAGRPGFDLVCTHYFLDLFAEETLGRAMDRLQSVLEPDGLWTCADFAPPRGNGARRLVHGGLLAGLYGFFRLACAIEARALPGIEEGFRRRGFVEEGRGELCGGLVWSAVFRVPSGATSPGSSFRNGSTGGLRSARAGRSAT